MSGEADPRNVEVLRKRWDDFFRRLAEDEDESDEQDADPRTTPTPESR